MIRLFPGLCLLGLGLSLSTPSFAAAPLIAVTESSTNTAPRTLQLEIRPTVEAALKERGAAVVPHAKVTGDLAKCTSNSCAVRIGAATGATHVLVINSSYVDDGYKMRLQVFDGRNGRELYSDGQVCEVCTHDDLTKALRERTAILWSRIQAEETLPQLVPGANPVVAPAAAPTPAPPFADTAAPPPAVESTLSKSWIPITMFGIGVLAGGYGVWALSRNHDTTGSCSSLDAPTRCQHYSSKTVGAPALVGGGLLAAAGLVWEIVILVRNAQSGTTTRHVSLAPDNVAYTVRF